jgi:hypothetical protein
MLLANELADYREWPCLFIKDDAAYFMPDGLVCSDKSYFVMVLAVVITAAD